MQDPFIQAVLRIAMQHYHGQPPMAFVNRIAPTLRSSPQGRTVLGGLSAGSPNLIQQFVSHGLNNYPFPAGGSY